MLLLPYNESLQSEFLMLNCCAKNRAEMNGPHSVSSAKQLFDKVLNDPNTYSMAVLDSHTREYMGHVFVCQLDTAPELGFIFDKVYWGQGFAYEALKAFFPKACRELKLSRVIATANTHHEASIKLLSKLGFKHSGQQKDLYGPYYEFVFTSDVAVDESSLA
ncbi:GNAT family N-acetyltransferase [Vibrio paucivorans]